VLGCGGRCPWLMLAWVAMADLLVFSAFVSSFQSLLVSVGIAADGFVAESYRDQWTMVRTSYLLHHFLFPLMLLQTVFLETYIITAG
jgi:hypothetical protein